MGIDYPIMTRNHEMISPTGAIPEGIAPGNDVNVVGNKALEANPRVAGGAGVGAIDEANDVDDTDGDEEEESLVGVASGERESLALHFIHELTFYAVDKIHGSRVEEGPLSFIVHPYFQSFLHLYVTPTHNNLPLSQENYFI